MRANEFIQEAEASDVALEAIVGSKISYSPNHMPNPGTKK